MALALKLSKLGQGGVGANPMVGCVISSDDKIIAKDYHHHYGQEHAEINALNQIKHKADNCKLYVTLEPCSMCFGALYWSQISRIVYSAKDKKNEFNGYQLKIHPKTTIEGGVLANQTEIMLKEFFKSKRS